MDMVGFFSWLFLIRTVGINNVIHVIVHYTSNGGAVVEVL